jgi:protein-S-isoprenylcysteine O-methyltransferase Ste14
VRHPIYTGLLAITLGLVVSSGVWGQILIWLALAMLLTYKMRWEEVMLVAKYKGYAEYKSRVPAIFPKLRPSK